MAHVYYGDPNEEFSNAQIKTLVKNGTDIIEFGIPFSDPTADGPTFRKACERALKGGITPRKCINGLRNISLNVPVVVTTYYNIPYKFGVEPFIKEIKDAGASGLIIPNLPIEEASETLGACKKHNLDLIFLVTSTTTRERLRKILAAASGFIYVVSRFGVTGARDSLEQSTLALIKNVRQHTDLPILVGFGISKPEHAEAVVAAGASGAIVGSAFAKIYEKNLAHPEERLKELGALARGLKRGCEQGLLRRKNKYGGEHN